MDCIEILEAGLRRADPLLFMPTYVKPNAIVPPGAPAVEFADYTSIHTVSFGKAADSMARAFNNIVPQVESGIIVMPKGYRSKVRSRKFRIFNTGHPVPDRASTKAAREVVKFLQNRRPGDLVVFLVSGGGSSLLALPAGITLDDKVHVTGMLLKSGASIAEINCVRKQLSRIKGGRLLRHMRCSGIGLLVSDVEGDDISTIASGTTHTENSTTRRDALDVLEKYNLVRRAGRSVIDALGRTDAYSDDMVTTAVMKKKEEEKAPVPEHGAGTRNGRRTSNRTFAPSRMIGNYIIARNTDCLDAMGEAARGLGYGISDNIPVQTFCDIKDAAETIYGMIPVDTKKCLIFGGENTVKVLGRGTGGRNHEMVLRLLKKCQNKEPQKITIASMGTDGIDGNTVHAGAITSNMRVDVGILNDVIKNSDSGGFFEGNKKGRGGGVVVAPSCIHTGPTHTNLLDIGVILT